MSKPINPAEAFLLRYNFVILVVVIASVLGTSIFLAYNTYISAADPTGSEVTSDVPTNFDQATREKIDSLHSSNDTSIKVSPPAGRINPFSE